MLYVNPPDETPIEVLSRDVESDLAALEAGAPFSWLRLGRLLDLVEMTHYWQRQSASSFTQWVSKFSQARGITASTLWRYRSAARLFRQTGGNLGWGLRLDLRALQDQADKVSPEAIEILAKLSRVAPPYMLRSFVERVFRGEVTRAELRTAWQAFRPALGGRTARGRGAVPPRVNLDDPQQYDSVLEAMVFNALLDSKGGWTGEQSPDLYKLFLGVTAEPRPDRTGSVVFDAVAVVRPRAQQSLDVHGIDYVGVYYHDDAMEPDLQERSMYCDFLWVVYTEGGGRTDLSAKGTGLLLVKNGQVEVVRPAARISDHARNQKLLLKGLLARTMSR